MDIPTRLLLPSPSRKFCHSQLSYQVYEQLLSLLHLWTFIWLNFEQMHQCGYQDLMLLHQEPKIYFLSWIIGPSIAFVFIPLIKNLIYLRFKRQVGSEDLLLTILSLFILKHSIKFILEFFLKDQDSILKFQ